MNVKTKNKIRLFVNTALAEQADIILDERQSHYACNVMRLQQGDILSCFNGQDGEFDCILERVSKKECHLKVLKKTRAFKMSPNVWLLFAPVKKDCTDFIVEKAVELGVVKINPVITRYTQAGVVRVDRFKQQAIEAAEQCRRVDVPEIAKAETLTKLLQDWDKDRILFFMDESGGGQPAAKVFAENKSSPAALLVGPEGGFATEELDFLRKLSFSKAVSLGSRILRAETAAVAALSVWQATAGDWVE